MRRSLLVLAVAATALVACGDDGGGAQPATTVPTAASEAPVPTAASDGSTAPAASETSVPTAASEAPTVPAALQFSAPAVGGGSIDFASYAGRTVALWFWAPT